MENKNFRELIEARWSNGKFVCVGLDPEPQKLPPHLNESAGYRALSEFLEKIVDATKDEVCAYKPNMAFFEALGLAGERCLESFVTYAHAIAQDVPVILDGKRGDIGNTNLGYIASVFKRYCADAVTVNGYLGGESLRPFLEWKDKGIFVLCRTSNPGASEFQDYGPAERPLYVHLAHRFATTWNTNDNVGLVVGATYPEEIGKVRAVAPDVPLLIPGIGVQGGDLEKTVKAAKGRFVINSSRGIIYASSGTDFAEAARREVVKLNMAINHHL